MDNNDNDNNNNKDNTNTIDNNNGNTNNRNNFNTNNDNNNDKTTSDNPPTHCWSSVLGVLNIPPFAFMMIPHPLVLKSTQIPHDPTSTQLRSQLRSHVSSYTAQIQLTQHQLC